MDPLDALGDDRPDAQVHRAEGRVLPRGALAVAHARHDGRGQPLLLDRRAPLGELFIHIPEDEGAVLGDVGAVLVRRARGRDVVGGDLVAHLDGDFGLELGRHRGVGGRGADVRAAAHLLLARGLHDHAVVDGVRGRELHAGVDHPQGGRVGEHPGQGRGHGRLGAGQVDVRVRGAAPALVVAVAGPHRDPARGRRLARAHAEPAGRLHDPAAGGDHVVERAVGGDHLQHLAAPRGDRHAHLGVDLPPLQHARHDHQVVVGGVGAAPDAHLVDLDRLHLPDLLHVVRGVGQGHVGLDGGKVDVDRLVVLGPGVRLQLRPLAFPMLGLEEPPGHLVAREDGGGHPGLGAHVGDDPALRHGQVLQARAAVLDRPAHVPLGGDRAEHLQDDVLGRHPGPEPVVQVDLQDLGVAEVELPPAHDHGHVEPARAHGQHPHGAAGGGVAVAAEEGPAGPAEALQVELVADAVPGPGVEDAVLVGDRLQVAVVVGVLEPVLEHLVVHVGDGKLGLHLGDPDGLVLEVGHHPQPVLGQGGVDDQADLAPGLHLAAPQVGRDDLLVEVPLPGAPGGLGPAQVHHPQGAQGGHRPGGQHPFQEGPPGDAVRGAGEIDCRFLHVAVFLVHVFLLSDKGVCRELWATARVVLNMGKFFRVN